MQLVSLGSGRFLYVKIGALVGYNVLFGSSVQSLADSCMNYIEKSILDKEACDI